MRKLQAITLKNSGKGCTSCGLLQEEEIITQVLRAQNVHGQPIYPSA